MKTTVVKWVDAVWEFPARAVEKFGSEHEFVTKIAKFTTREPLANYRVRYKIIDGPAAIFLPSRTQEHVAISNLNGEAKVKIAQQTPASGINHVSVEIIRPPDPTTPSGAGVTIVTGETSVEWLAPDVKLSHAGPPSAGLGQNVTFTTTAKNDGRIESQWVELTLPVPDGMDFVSSNPPAVPSGGKIILAQAPLGVGQIYTVTTTFRAKTPGVAKSVALMRTGEGLTAQHEADVNITTPGLKVEIGAPKTGIVDVLVSYGIRLTNTGTGDLDDIQLVAEYDPGLESDQVKNPANDKKLNILRTTLRGGLKGGDTRTETLPLTPRRPGQYAVKVTASSGGLQAQDTFVITIAQPKVSLNVQGPDKRYVGRPAEYKIIVKNEGDVDQTGVVIRDKLPPELTFKLASRAAAPCAGGGGSDLEPRHLAAGPGDRSRSDHRMPESRHRGREAHIAERRRQCAGRSLQQDSDRRHRGHPHGDARRRRSGRSRQERRLSHDADEHRIGAGEEDRREGDAAGVTASGASVGADEGDDRGQDRHVRHGGYVAAGSEGRVHLRMPGAQDGRRAVPGRVHERLEHAADLRGRADDAGGAVCESGAGAAESGAAAWRGAAAAVAEGIEVDRRGVEPRFPGCKPSVLPGWTSGPFFIPAPG